MPIYGHKGVREGLEAKCVEALAAMVESGSTRTFIKGISISTTQIHSTGASCRNYLWYSSRFLFSLKSHFVGTVYVINYNLQLVVMMINCRK